MAVSEEDILYLSSQLEARLSAIQRENTTILSKLRDYKVAYREGQRVNRHLYRRLMCAPLPEGRKNGGGARIRGGGASSRGRSRGGASGKRASVPRQIDEEEGESEAASRRRLMAQQRRLWKQRQQQQQKQQKQQQKKQQQQHEEEEQAMLQPQEPPQQQVLLQSQQQPRPAVVQLTGVQVVTAPSVTMTVPHVVLQIPASQAAIKAPLHPPTAVPHVTVLPAAFPTAVPPTTKPPTTQQVPSSSPSVSPAAVSSNTAKQRLEAAFKAFAKRTGPAIQQDLARSGGGALNQRTLAQELVKRWGQLSDAERKSYFAAL